MIKGEKNICDGKNNKNKMLILKKIVGKPHINTHINTELDMN